MTPKSLLVLCALLPVAGCATGRTLRHPYPVATVSYEYAPADRSQRQWRAKLTALDECHMKGYQDAEPKGPPQTVCEKSGARSCTVYRASIAYDCIGMGYQDGD